MIRKGMLAIGLLAATAVMAQTEVSDYTPGINAEGVTYFLPRTVVDITLEAEKVTYTPGEFCNYANKFLRLQGISSTPETYWEIKNVEVKTSGVIDPEKGFTIKLKDKSVAPLVELSDDGVLLSINVEKEKGKRAEPERPEETKRTLNPKDLLGEEVLTVTSTAKMAELVAKEIYAIRDSRNAIVRGQADNVPQDGEGLKLMLKSLEEQDEALTSMFKGTVSREKRILTVRLTPVGDSVDKQVLFRFSRKLGIVGANDLSGEPVYYDMESLVSLPQPDEKTAKKARRPQGVVYNIPGKVLLRIYKGGETLYEEELPVAQLGNVDVLSSDLFNKNAGTRVTFDPATGAIRKVERE